MPYGRNSTYGKSIYKDVSLVATSVEVTPQNAEVANGSTQQYTATVLDQLGNPMPDQTLYQYTWSVNGGGTISTTGLFTAQVDVQGNYIVTATEVTTGLVGTATVEIVIPETCNDGTLVPKTYVIDIIKRAMRLIQVIGATETPEAQQATDFLQVLNWMLEEWTVNKTFCYYIENQLFPTVANKQTYIIGPDPLVCDFVTLTPIKITSCFIRDTSPGYNNDWDLESVTSARWNQIFQKAVTSSYPRFFYYEHSWPNGTLNIWPNPTKAYKINISQWHQFTKFTSLQDVVCLPPGYKDALSLSLAVKMAPEFGKDVPGIEGMATKALSALRDSNYQPDIMATDSALLTRGNPWYNIYSDRVW